MVQILREGIVWNSKPFKWDPREQMTLQLKLLGLLDHVFILTFTNLVFHVYIFHLSCGIRVFETYSLRLSEQIKIIKQLLSVSKTYNICQSIYKIIILQYLKIFSPYHRMPLSFKGPRSNLPLGPWYKPSG